MTNYETIAELGTGGFATVYECKAPDGSVVAKKVLNKDDTQAKERFAREVKILSNLKHPNIVQVLSVQLRAEPLYFVMPKYSHSLRSCYPQIVNDESRIIPIFLAILDAVEHAHSKSVIHRDLKPSNVLMNSDADLVVSDFGLGKILDASSSDETLTGSGTTFGTQGYACPEQFELEDAKHADVRCDIFSLGVMLYEMYAGILRSIAQLDKLPPRIRYLVDKCTKNRPEDRIQSVKELRRAFLAAMGLAGSRDGQELRKLAISLHEGSVDDRLEALVRFTELLASSDRDNDFGGISDAMLFMGPNTLSDLFHSNTGFTISLLTRFLEYVDAQEWVSVQAVQLGELCDSLFGQIPAVKAGSLRSLILLSKQNRSKLASKARKRILQQHDLAELGHIRDALVSIDADLAREVYLDVARSDRLASEIREGFECAITGAAISDSAVISAGWSQFLAGLKQANESLYDKLVPCVKSHQIKSRTVFIQLKDNAPFETFESRLAFLERVWKQANTWAAVLVILR